MSTPDGLGETKDLREDYDYLAPDGSEIRLLPSLPAGGLAHCTLPPGGVTAAVRHRTVEEIWYVLEGRGQVWRRNGDTQSVVDVYPGRSLVIPTGVDFQFRTAGDEPLQILIATLPEWPGSDEAEPRQGRWRPERDTREGPGRGMLHHVSLPVSDLERSRRFYRENLGLREVERPPFDFPGAWFAVGGGQLHLIVGEDSTFRTGKGLDARDAHFAVRVPSYREAKAFLESKGYSTELDEHDLMTLKASPKATAGFPQLYVLDPDRNVVEINAEKLDREDGEA